MALNTDPVVLGLTQTRTDFKWDSDGMQRREGCCAASHTILRISGTISRKVTPFSTFTVIAENRKQPASTECLVSLQKMMEGSELELAKVPVGCQTGEGAGCFVPGALDGWGVRPGSHLSEAAANSA